VRHAMHAIETEAKKLIPYQMLPDMDGYQLDYEKALLYLNNHVFRFGDAAKATGQPRILWGFTVDGVRVSQNATLIIAGVNCIDPHAIDPKTGVFISLVQSPELCFLLKVLVCSNSKTTYSEHLSNFFAWFKDLGSKQVGEYPPGTF
jgi:hypothetical protein